ncbi:hypothetical protein [Leekyejoonella antrihumi]|uniref:hypothetical protein n=1 Tax=Leekyejoonella antrihumi TaxID=1660198 RepID=UPI001C97C420|nr:hypothetical protein [Leekyejoonella antrihumi]
MLLEEIDALTAKIHALTARATQLIEDIPAAAAPPGSTDPADSATRTASRCRTPR